MTLCDLNGLFFKLTWSLSKWVIFEREKRRKEREKERKRVTRQHGKTKENSFAYNPANTRES